MQVNPFAHRLFCFVLFLHILHVLAVSEMRYYEGSVKMNQYQRCPNAWRHSDGSESSTLRLGSRHFTDVILKLVEAELHVSYLLETLPVLNSIMFC